MIDQNPIPKNHTKSPYQKPLLAGALASKTNLFHNGVNINQHHTLINMFVDFIRISKTHIICFEKSDPREAEHNERRA